MITLSRYRKLLCFAVLFVWFGQSSFLYAQVGEQVYKSDTTIDREKKGELSVELDNVSFFKNNEFAGTVVDGYTLPGLWLQPKAVYYPLENIKLEAGVHMLFYHGTDKYPSVAYLDIARWKGGDSKKGAHILPFFRAQIALSDKVDFIIGDLYGGANHNLIEPLYNPELNLTADPETGLQFLFKSRLFDADAWINWQSFIYKEDDHLEAFTFGVSSRLKLNNPESSFHFYVPVQGLLQHRGGEIDTITQGSVQTLVNGAAGIGAEWNANRKLLKRINLELDAAAYYQQAGSAWPLDDGLGLYAKLSADIHKFRVKTSYWQSRDFVSVFGSPFYGSLSTKENKAVYEKPQMVYFGLEYSHSFGKGYSVGADFDLYYMLSDKINNPETGIRSIESATNMAFGVYVRINPSFFIKRF